MSKHKREAADLLLQDPGSTRDRIESFRPLSQSTLCPAEHDQSDP